MRVYIFIILSFFSLVLHAQDSSPHKFFFDSLFITEAVLQKDTVIDLAAYAGIYEDTLLSYPDPATIPVNEFVPIRKSMFNRDTRSSYITWWLKFSVINRTGIDSLPVSFYFGKHALIKLYDTCRPHEPVAASGFLWFDKSARNTNVSYENKTVLPKGIKQTYYVEVTDFGRMSDSIKPQLFLGKSFEHTFIQAEQNNKPALMLNVLIIGGILVLGFFVFAQFFSNRDITYLYYALYAFAACSFLERALEFNFNIRFISILFPYYFFRTSTIQGLITGIFYIFFVQSFLEFKTNYKKLLAYCRFLLAILLSGLLIIIWVNLFRVKMQWMVYVDLGLNLLPLFGAFILIMLIIINIRKNPLVKFITGGYSFILIGSFTDIYLNNSEKFFSFSFPPVIYLELGILFEIFFFALGLGYKKKLLEIEKKQAQFKNLELEMYSLRAQMNPHFIFNCLNSIKLYAEENRSADATEYLTKFSKLLRLVLENSKRERISLFSELEALVLYIQMEAMRFKEKLQYSIDVERNVETDYIEIPPLLLQPYVENAIWHGLMHKEEGGRINISVRLQNDESLLEINITDNGIGRVRSAELKSKAATTHKSFGMKVTSERIALINQIYKTGSDVIIVDLADADGNASGTKVTIKIPL